MATNRQLSVLPSALPNDWAAEPGAAYGEVFTRRWVVEFILDLVGYADAADLETMTIVEPSCGTGAFLVPIVERLIASCEQHDRNILEAADAVRAFDLLPTNANLAAKAVLALLVEHGVEQHAAERLVGGWVRVGDFLLAEQSTCCADFVVGNPPYIRLEDVPARLTDEYRRLYPTMRGRSDIYVGFFERGIELLKPNGVLGFICADRWMHNQYGAALRELITSTFAVETVIAMHDVAAFEDDVSAYPAIIILRNGAQGATHVVEATREFNAASAAKVSGWVTGKTRKRPTSSSFDACKVETWFSGRDLWPSGSPSQLALLADLERRFTPLENAQTGTRVGIGVATGCDEVYITRDPDLVEHERLLPLLLAGDLANGSPAWSGRYLVNPWNGSGLVDLAKYPKLRHYYEAHGVRLRARHTAKKHSDRWYRTIDAVDPALRDRPKLLLPDMKAAAHPVLDAGGFYPHHNLYYVVSDEWDLEVLGGLLLSDVANLFVGAYCVKMRGGTYRFQAQYLRKIRVPDPAALDTSVADALRAAFRTRDTSSATRAAAEAYSIEQSALGRARR